ncbi:type II CRISPR RNA-guided endonuclease Cas9 [Helicobacter sp. 11S03491-1]|uniref:type II CRISPR RNA-guided endonuclease Cas9 n=1 Tax=Helicobacter sp. 11S03491-1 TaxID=1476196 RepID=UPI000BA6FCBF|nr:type II CRISPR RNA-guided endonuclease Cas9 [Helicobacter sp. 11S03491-1]PAF41808.1 type II CRISPR RNA-guided endonuclease Cas9 [Helicobacter sp. 11S03491-1]
MVTKILGIDIGITSIGWGLIEVDNDNKENSRIIDCGVRLFSKAENPKDGKSLALPRRLARSTRRNFKRKRVRVKQIKILLSKYLDIKLEDFISEDEHLPEFFITNKNFISPWQLRSDGLDRKLNNKEFARVLLHIAKRRGYNDKTNISEETIENKESKIILEAINTNKEQMQKAGYRTIGEMMFKKYYNKEISKGKYENVRNHKSKDSKEISYRRSIGREELKKEIEILFCAQRKFGNQKATQDMQKSYMDIAFYQRDLKSFESMVGDCEFFKDQKRACKCCFSAEKFINLGKIINTLIFVQKYAGEVYSKEKIQEKIQEILSEAEKTKLGITYKKLRKILNLEGVEKFEFSALDYTKISKIKTGEEEIIKQKDPESQIFIKFEKYHKLKDYLSEFSEEFEKLSQETLDNIANIIAFNKSPKILEEKLSFLSISEAMRQKLIQNQLNFNQTINLSLKALYKILPIMEQGSNYREALEEAKLLKQDSNNKKDFLPPLSETEEFSNVLNPVVNRAISQYRKVVNSVLRKYGEVHKIHIELAREVGKSFADRKKIEKEQKELYERNQEALKICKTIGLEPNGQNILKVKLWIRQNEICVYSGKKISSNDLKNDKKDNSKNNKEDDKKLEIDHIYPLSRSLDDSQNNKVLVFAKVNDEKNDRTPYEWLKGNEQKWNTLIIRLRTMCNLPENVKRKIVDKNFMDKKLGTRGEYLTRNLNDTGYISRLVSQYTNEYLKFLPLEENENIYLKSGVKSSKKHIVVISGSLTAMLRHYWGLDSKNRDTHLHHAQDALILAFTTDSNIKAFTDYLKSKEEGYYKKIKADRKALELRKSDNKAKYLLRDPIKNFRSKTKEAVEKIFISRASQRKVTGTLHEETIRSKKDYFKSYGGEKGVQKALELGKIRQINGGIFDNGDMVRVDIFKSKDKGKYYVVPVYSYDIAIGKLPNKAIVYGKDKEGVIKDWLEMDSNYEFCFSLFRNDLVQIQTKKMQNFEYAYYVSTDSGTGSLTFRHHSNYLSSESEKVFFKIKKSSGFLAQNCGIQDLKIFKKCIVSVLGEINEAKFEPRKDIKLKTTKK